MRRGPGPGARSPLPEARREGRPAAGGRGAPHLLFLARDLRRLRVVLPGAGTLRAVGTWGAFLSGSGRLPRALQAHGAAGEDAPPLAAALFLRIPPSRSAFAPPIPNSLGRLGPPLTPSPANSLGG